MIIVDPVSGEGMAKLIIGLGIGRCRTKSLAALLRVPHEFRANRAGKLPWAFDAAAVELKLLAIRAKGGDVAFYYLPYVEHVNSHAACVFICLKRDREATINSYLSWAGKRNFWQQHDGSQWQHCAWDKCHPKYGSIDRGQAVARFYDEYYADAEALEAKLPNFRIFRTASLSTSKGCKAILDFVGMKRRQLTGVRLNAGKYPRVHNFEAQVRPKAIASDVIRTANQPYIIAMLSVPRAKSYIHESIKSLLESDFRRRPQYALHIYAGSPDAAYLDEYRRRPRIKIHHLAKEDHPLLALMSLPGRFNYNYLRCLKATNSDGVVICEDDVRFRPDWLERLEAAKSEMANNRLNGYALALYAPAGTPSCPLKYPRLARGTNYCGYVAASFYGTQAMYFPMESAHAAAHHLLAYGFKPEHPAADIVLNQWFRSKKNLYATVRSIVQHVGRQSTGLGRFHQSNTFVLPWPDESTEVAQGLQA